MRNLALLRYRGWILMGELRRFVLHKVRDSRYLMCCNLPKYSNIFHLEGLGLRKRVHKVVSIIFLCWDDEQVR